MEILTAIFSSVLIAVFLFLTHHVLESRKQSNLLNHIPLHTFEDGSNSRQRYLTELKSLLETGYRKYNQANTPFKIPIPVGGYSVKYRIILPKDHIEEIKHLSNNVFSWQLASRIIFAGDYTGAPDRGPWSGKALRVGIHQNLDTITEELDQRITAYLSEHLPQRKGEVTSFDLMSFFIPAISSVVNTLLVGPELASQPEWTRRTAEFALDRYIAADDVRQWPPYLATLVAPFIPSVRRLRDSRVYVKEKMRPLYEVLRTRESSNSKERQKMRKGSWGFEWLWGGAPSDVTLQDFSDTMMRTIIASIHTSAKTLTVALIDLLTQPKLLEELREEVKNAFDPSTSYIELDKLVKLDCFLKESQRLTPVFLMTMNRVLTQDYTFKCSGIRIPKGSITMAPAAAIATDPYVFEDPNTFDGFRYRRLREANKNAESSFVMGMSTVDSLGFGLGNQACPGRFMAVNNLKLFLARLLDGWDLALEKAGQEYHGARPTMQYKDFSVVPPTEFNLRVCKS